MAKVIHLVESVRSNTNYLLGIYLNHMGRLGWELLSHEYSFWNKNKTFIFKREAKDYLKLWEYRIAEVKDKDKDSLEYSLNYKLDVEDYELCSHEFFAFSNKRLYIYKREIVKKDLVKDNSKDNIKINDMKY